jgi:hypothetical protein
MFIIHRRTVEAGGKRDKVDAVYWILNERIYPTPSLYDIMANRTVCFLLPSLRTLFLSVHLFALSLSLSLSLFSPIYCLSRMRTRGGWLEDEEWDTRDKLTYQKNAAFLLSETFSTLSALHPPSNPRTNNIWRSLPPTDPEVEKRKVAESGDVEMTTATPRDGTDAKTQEKAKEEVEEADWNLFHALQSTRGAMSELREAARNPPPEEVVDPASLLSQRGTSASIPRLSVNGSSTGTRTPGHRNSGLPEAGVHRSLMISRAEGR